MFIPEHWNTENVPELKYWETEWPDMASLKAKPQNDIIFRVLRKSNGEPDIAK